MSRISICFIIPYYKIPLPILQRCIGSVKSLGQSVDWEIRLIDDGTPGHETERLVTCLGDPRIHYHRKENGGLSTARNTGWELTQKEYIHFLDADDYLFIAPATQALELLEKEHPDLLAFNCIKVYDTEIRRVPFQKLRVKFRGSGTKYMQRHNLHGHVWGYFFRREAAGDLRFTHDIYHEDEELTPLLWLRMKHVVVTTLPVYAYYQREGSIMHAPDEKTIRKRYNDLCGIISRLRDESQRLPKVQGLALRRRADMVAMAMIYTLMKESPNPAFLRNMLEQMREGGFYPLPLKYRSLLYTAFRICTLTPTSVYLLSRWVFHGKFD